MRATNRSGLRVALAGLGSMGRNHLRHLVSREDVELVALADPDEEARRSALMQVGNQVHAYSDPVDMIGAEELDAMVVAVPTTQHFPVAMAAISAGVNVLVEKPIAASVVDGEHLVRSAEDHGVVLQVGHIERFNPVVVALAERLRGGDLSRIHSVKTVRGGPMPHRIRDVGVAVDLATHDIDIMIHLLGEQPVRVSAESSRQVNTAHEDLLYGLLHFPSGVIGLLDVNWLTPEKQRKIVVLGTEGMFVADYLTQSLTFTRGRAELSPEYHGGYAAMFDGEVTSVPVAEAEPLGRELDAFLETVRAGGSSPVSGKDGLLALRVAKLLLNASDEGRSVPVAARRQV